jgi:ABC-2 type transport system ATP-binding protein
MFEPAIHIEQLSRSFGAVKAVDNLSLEVPAGIVFGFLGPNGAGKTTTIHLLLGLLEPTAGQARVLGFDTRTQAEAIRAHSGALLEFSGLYERMSAQDNLDFYGRIYHMPASARQARIKELLSHLNLWERRRDLVGTWSRGMKQKLAVARALFHHPSLVFLDEPSAGFDPVAAAALRDDLANLVAREGVNPQFG